MASFINHPIIFCLFVITGIVISGSEVALGQCKGDLNGVMEQCAKYVQKAGPKVAPSTGCCSVLKTVDVPCVCAHIPKQAEEIISIDKAVYVSRFCGIPLPHGTKCGSYTIP
ncbi:Protein MEN-8 like [Actinidia chinensis var. chinensis]|uniref:Protein MEN-8 like n=1 Tax=Actinidia chinensis var. chinensis TaxID=1590841 RepID=A0A2R6RA53_ACTCC|nr:Protein MEN-8 like [Actinidia chinensis var. chinensis]